MSANLLCNTVRTNRRRIVDICLFAESEVIDVIVEHEIYRELTGNLRIKTEQDVADFMRKYQHSQARLLSDLTNGIHLHTLRYQEAAES